MSYRGKKCLEQERLLRKKSLIDVCDLRPQRRKGGGSRTKSKASREWHSLFERDDVRRVLRDYRDKWRGIIAAHEKEGSMKWSDYCMKQADFVMEHSKSFSCDLLPYFISSAERYIEWAGQEYASITAISLTQENPNELGLDDCIAEAALLMRQAGYCEHYSPETADLLREQADYLNSRACMLLDERRRQAYPIRYNSQHGNVSGPVRRYEYWNETKDGEVYRYERTTDWVWYGWYPKPEKKHEPPCRMRKAQYTAYAVPQEYLPRDYVIYMPVTVASISEVIQRSETYESFARRVENATRGDNFMGGVSYTMVSPLDTLKLISAGSIFGEPMYYRESKAKIDFDSLYGYGWEDDAWYERDTEHPEDKFFQKMTKDFRLITASQVMERVIDESLNFDFEGTLEWAVELRGKFLMRLNPQVIIVRAAVHPDRAEFTKHHPGKFQEFAQKVMSRGDDVIHQMEYYLSKRGSKNGIPAILKRSWAKRIASMDAYSMSKYANAGTGLIDTVRICHAKSPLVNTLMREGRVPMPEGQDTWERLRASGMCWKDILATIRMPHMALLRNLRGIFSEVDDPETLNNALALLKRGVRGGKQFPFRYYTAWKIFEDEKGSWLWDAIARLFPCHEKVQATLEECINISCENLPELPGRCAFLTDNSGSAWETHTSEYGSMSMAEIGNLSSVIGAMRAEKGVVYTFGDTLRAIPIDRNAGVLEQARLVNTIGHECGMMTESGLYAFFRDAVSHGQHWDSIFVYSDMQTGSGRTFGTNPSCFRKMGALRSGGRIDVNELVKEYRREVNPKLNVVCVQTSGYTNAVMPEYGYRSSILCGWTGKELEFADEVRRLWDSMEASGETYILDIDSRKVNLCGF